MTDRSLTRHPLSYLCGDMDAESFKALANDIREQGQLETIDLVGDEIVDGWHRYRACQLLGLEPKTRVLPDGLELVEYVLGKNAHRRHMTAEQRAAVVMLAAEWMPAHRPAANGKDDTVSSLSNEAAGERAGVSKRTIQRVKAQIRAGYGEALATGSETLRSLAAKAKRAAAVGARENAGTAVGEKRKERSKVAELRDQVAFLKTEIERRDARISELMEEVERLTLERDELLERGDMGARIGMTMSRGP